MTQLADVFERPITIKEAAAELAAIEAELQRRARTSDPVIWAQEKLGDTFWSGQKKILQSVRDNRKTAVATCHEIGKSRSAGVIAAWWIDSHRAGDAYVITTAPTAPQVRIILWKEIGRAHARGNLGGRINQTEWMMRVVDPKTGVSVEESVAIGRKPSDYTPAAFQGKHAPYVLIIVDEANGVRGPLWDAMDSLMANDTSKLLAIGNPDDPSGEFYELCKPNSGCNVIHVSAFDSPNFTGEELPEEIKKQLIGKQYVEERRQKWAPTWSWSSDGKICVMPTDG